MLRNPLLVPDLRELIQAGEIAALRDFFAEQHPAHVAEVIEDMEEVEGDTITGAYRDAGEVLDALARVGVDYDDVTALLEREGVEKFVVSWHELVDTVRVALEGAR